MYPPSLEPVQTQTIDSLLSTTQSTSATIHSGKTMQPIPTDNLLMCPDRFVDFTRFPTTFAHEEEALTTYNAMGLQYKI